MIDRRGICLRIVRHGDAIETSGYDAPRHDPDVSGVHFGRIIIDDYAFHRNRCAWPRQRQAQSARISEMIKLYHDIIFIMPQ